MVTRDRAKAALSGCVELGDIQRGKLRGYLQGLTDEELLNIEDGRDGEVAGNLLYQYDQSCKESVLAWVMHGAMHHHNACVAPFLPLSLTALKPSTACAPCQISQS